MPRQAMNANKIGELMRELSLSAIMDAVPMRATIKALKEKDKLSKRERLLPAHLVVYLVILLAFFSDVSIKENLRILLEALRRRFGLKSQKPAVKSAITKARKRLGSEPFKKLYNDTVKPLGDKNLPGCFWNKYRIVSADGTTVDVQYTPQNIERFGIHKNQHGKSGYPAFKSVVLLEGGTRIPLGAETGGEHDSEGKIFDNLYDKLEKDMLLLLDRHYYSFKRFKDCSKYAGALLWRICSNLKPRILKELPDGSAVVELKPSDKLWRNKRCKKNERIKARLIEYQAVFEDGTLGEKTRLLTTLTCFKEAPAEELASLYTARWISETGFDELKTHMRGPNRVLRSQLPDLVEQEFYGFLLAYYVVRATMVDAARKSGLSPSEISFVHSVRVIRRKLAFPPADAD